MTRHKRRSGGLLQQGLPVQLREVFAVYSASLLNFLAEDDLSLCEIFEFRVRPISVFSCPRLRNWRSFACCRYEMKGIESPYIWQPVLASVLNEGRGLGRLRGHRTTSQNPE